MARLRVTNINKLTTETAPKGMSEGDLHIKFLNLETNKELTVYMDKTYMEPLCVSGVTIMSEKSIYIGDVFACFRSLDVCDHPVYELDNGIDHYTLYYATSFDELVSHGDNMCFGISVGSFDINNKKFIDIATKIRRAFSIDGIFEFNIMGKNKTYKCNNFILELNEESMKLTLTLLSPDMAYFEKISQYFLILIL